MGPVQAEGFVLPSVTCPIVLKIPGVLNANTWMSASWF